jgi:imidazolonepropionase
VVRIAADFVIEHASLVATCAGPAPRRGAAQGDITPIRDASIAAHQGVIVYVGPASDAEYQLDLHDEAVRLDAHGCTVVPGFVDPHTHLVFAGNRQDELRRRLAGATYETIAAEGGGIMKTVALTRAASETQLADAARPRLDEMLAAGTTTCEAKSGYGLTTESELTQLRAIQHLNRTHTIDIVPTFLGAHDIPSEFKSRRADYVACIVNEMIPRVAAEGLAEWCDVFCDAGYFTPEESMAILDAGRRAGLESTHPRRPARDQRRMQCRCACGRALGGSSGSCGRVGGGRTGIGRYLRRAAPDRRVLFKARALRTSAIADRPSRAVALATDVNPGGGFSPSMPFAMSLACFGMDMTLEESLVASTLNAAWSLDRADCVGSLELAN